MAPKLKKNWRKAKHTMNAGLLSEWKLPAMTPTVNAVSVLPILP